jgi:superfamily II DNA or RNA helicase
MSLREAFKTNKRVLFVLATGGGKTAVFTAIAQASKKRILILAHRKELIDQITDRLGNYDTERITVGMVQTIAKRGCEIEPEFIIIDEAHHTAAGSWQKILEAYPDAYVLGVTATPCRLDGHGLAPSFQTMIEGPSIRELISMGYLCNAVTYGSERDYSMIKTSGSDYSVSSMQEHLMKSKITGEAVNEWRKYANEKQTIVFCVSIKHAEFTAAMFSCVGHKAEVLTSRNTKEERGAIIMRFKNKETRLLVSVDIISEGFDVPSCEAVILMRPTKSLSLYLQQVGRALRTHEGKDKAIILDHAGNCFRHGLATQHRVWELTSDKVSAASVKWEMRQCKRCYAVFSSASDICPECGTKPEPKPKEMKMVAGVLVPVEEVEERKKEAKRELAGQKTYADWLAIEKARGYKSGWAWHRFNARKS